MLNLPSIRPDFLPISTQDVILSRSEQILYWTIVLTPLWWLIGIQPLLYPAVISGLLFIHFDIDKVIRGAIPASVWAWLVMSLVMLWTALLGLNEMGWSFQTAAAAVVTFFKSYFLIFACLALPLWSQVRVHVITRAVSWMATSYLLTIAVQLAMLVLKLGSGGYLPPLARILPGGDRSSLRVMFASFSSFLGIPLPRTVLYTPDPPIIGLCAVFCFLICLGESNRRLRTLALMGSISALIVSASRSAWLCLPVAFLIETCFESGLFRQLSLWLTASTLFACSVLGLTLEELFQKPVQAFTQARADSSAERAIVVRKTLEAWQESPWVGWGVIRGAAHLYDDVYITLGSFSTYAAVLYLNGVVGFIALIGAMLITLWEFYQFAIQGNTNCKRAFAGLLVLYIACNATPLSWMAVYLWFFFAWLGAVLFDARHDRSDSTPRTLLERNRSISSWDQL